MNLSPFEEFDLSPIIKALEKKGYTRPTPIQLEAIPAAMEERDVLGSANRYRQNCCIFIARDSAFIGLSTS